MFKDLFSGHSREYSRFRPVYPAALFDFLAKAAPARGTAWDCGTGNGQVARALVPSFDRILATDPSDAQLKNAAPDPKITYSRAPAERSGIADASIDLITVGQAFHWFDAPAFFREAQRVLRPGGLLALWCYGLCRVTPEIDALVLRLYEGELGPFWEKERALVDEGYASVRLPFEEVPHPDFEMSAEWGIEHFLGYLATWSALQTCIKKTGRNPLAALEPELRSAWGASPRRVTWDFHLKLGRHGHRV